MSKLIKLYPISNSNHFVTKREMKKENISLKRIKNILIKLCAVALFLGVILVTFLAYYLNSVFFTSIITGLFIIGCALFINVIQSKSSNTIHIKK